MVGIREREIDVVLLEDGGKYVGGWDSERSSGFTTFSSLISLSQSDGGSSSTGDGSSS